MIELEFKYEGGGVLDISNFDVDKLSFFELKEYVKELGFDNMVGLYYAIPVWDLKSCLRKSKSNIELIDMMLVQEQLRP